MSNDNDSRQQRSTVVSKVSGLVGLYAIFVFIAGWTYFNAYYSSFGFYARWLDLSATEILTKGFVILFEKHGKWLWLIYVFVLVVPILFEVFKRLRNKMFIQFVMAMVLLACLPLTYYIAKSAGLAAASINQSEETNLPYVQFVTKCGYFSGRLLFAKDHALYIHDLTQDKRTGTDALCPELSPKVHGTHFLYIFRVEDVSTIEILERQLEVEK